MTTYNVCEYRAYQVIFGSEKQYAVYEDIEGEKKIAI
jgi:phosphotransferase system IIB component